MVVVASAAAGCSGGSADDAGAPASSAAPTVVVTTSTTETPDVTPSTPADPAASSVAPSSTPSVVSTETIATVPAQAVPGIDSTDPFCRAWSEFAGSFQALAFESSASSDLVAAARLEVVASAAVTSAAQTLDDEYPEPIAFERDAFLDGVIGPFARRAGRASDELRTAGLSPAEIAMLGDLWLLALVDANGDTIGVVVVPVEVSIQVDVATGAFSSNVPAIAVDPSLVTQAEAPATFDYLAENCPDQGILAGNDAID